MRTLLKLYLIGVGFNLIVILYNYIREYQDYRIIEINLKGVILYLLLSWFIYPIILIKTCTKYNFNITSIINFHKTTQIFAF